MQYVTTETSTWCRLISVEQGVKKAVLGKVMDLSPQACCLLFCP